MRRAPSAPALPRTAPLISASQSSGELSIGRLSVSDGSWNPVIVKGNDQARPPALHVSSPLHSPNFCRVHFADIPKSGERGIEATSANGRRITQPTSEKRARLSEVRATVLSELLKSITDPANLYHDDMSILPVLQRWLGKNNVSHGRDRVASRPSGPAARHGRRANGDGQPHDVVDARDQHGSTLLMVASCFGKLNCVRLLVSSGANVEAVNSSGRTALFYTCLGPELPQRVEILDTLLRSGAGRALTSALMAAAQLGRMPLVRRLTAAGALSPGQICQLVCPAHADLHRAMCSVVSFDHAKALYRIVVVSPILLNGEFPARKKGLPLHIDVRPDQLFVALHHLGTEYAHPVLAAGNPLDIAAGSLAGVPTTTPSCNTEIETTLPASDGEGQQHKAHSIAPGAVVRVVGRPELWLRERLGRVHSWDAATGRYMVLLQQTPGSQHQEQAPLSANANDDEIIGEVPLMLRPQHVEVVCQMDSGTNCAAIAIAAPAAGSTGSFNATRTAHGTASVKPSGSVIATELNTCWSDMLL